MLRCRLYINVLYFKITEFQKLVDGFISVMENMAKEVEREKMKAIGIRNMLKSVAKQRESEQQQLQEEDIVRNFNISALLFIVPVCDLVPPLYGEQALIIEKSTELERLRIQHQSLQKTEQEQEDIIENLVLNH
ncbi:intraflagellar transport protein 20 homolog isoform X2 [Schistocerca gregaria]|uniref:intraflagellar transport protein 20 homolog isoform X2 n=1 Tax=Schistocerca gregaria TaxID=7010 RepID=UPI00211E3518|nr:intraflagellar transport protein 20 homolog isoform X2 [Schistocerca gregaria]